MNKDLRGSVIAYIHGWRWEENFTNKIWRLAQSHSLKTLNPIYTLKTPSQIQSFSTL